jgi:hypothetical protein
MASTAAKPLYTVHELAFRTQYAEVAERSRAAHALLPGTPGRLMPRDGTGHRYWYRGYYPVPGREVEDFVAKDGDDPSLQSMRERIAFSSWMSHRVRDLRRLGFQVADKAVARALVELHNTQLFAAGVSVVGTLCYMAWLNEFGALAVAARTQDIDLAQRQGLKLGAAAKTLPETVEAMKLQFVAVPGMPSQSPPTAFKRRGAESLRIDLLTDGAALGKAVAMPELQWHAQAVPFYDFLLRETRDAVVLAGGHCVPVKLPAPERFLWHKLYSSTARTHDPSKAQKDLLQAATLAAVLVEQDDADLSPSSIKVPMAVRSAAATRLPALGRLMQAHPQALQHLARVLSGPPRHRSAQR